MKPYLKYTLLFLLLVATVLSAVSCAPHSNPEKAVEKLEKKGYTVKELAVGGMYNYGEGVTAAYYASDGDGNVISIIYYETAENAKNAWTTVEALGKAYRADGIDEDDWSVGHSGKIIWFGTKDALSASR